MSEDSRGAMSGSGASDGRRKAGGRSSTSHPYFDLTQSLEVARAIHEKGGGTCTADQLVAFLGYTTVRSGTFQTRISAAKQFGLIRADGAALSITDRAQQALSPVMPEDSARAKVEAFLGVPLYSEVFERFRGSALPAEGGLKNLFMHSYGLSQDRAGPAVRVLMDSADQAGFFSASGDRSRLVRPSMTGGNGVLGPLVSEGAGKAAVTVDDGEPRENVTGSDGKLPGVHPAVIGLLRELPPPGKVWTTKQKNRFVAAFQATLDVIYPSDDEEQ